MINKNRLFSLALFFWFLSFIAIYLYVSSDVEKALTVSLPQNGINSWHIIIGVLSNGLLMPLQHLISLLILLYCIFKPCFSTEMICRYKTKHKWEATITGKTVLVAMSISVAEFILIILISSIIYGEPQISVWSQYPLTNIPLHIAVATVLVVRCIISALVAVIFVSCNVLFGNLAISAAGNALWLILCDIGQILTPPYISFKAVFFSSSFSFSFFLNDSFLSNILLSVVLPCILIIIVRLLSKDWIKHFPERGQQA